MDVLNTAVRSRPTLAETKFGAVLQRPSLQVVQAKNTNRRLALIVDKLRFASLSRE